MHLRAPQPITTSSYDREVNALRRPELTTESETFWRFDEPVLDDKSRQLLVGGFWPHQVKWWNLNTFVKVLVTGYGGGKCTRGDTEVYDPIAGVRRRVDELGDLHCVTHTSDRRLKPRKAKALYSGKKHCVALTLEDGSKLVLSDDHRVLTSGGWVPAKELKTTHRVVVPKKLPAANTIRVSDAEIKFVAYMMADGNGTQNHCKFSDNCTEILDDIQDVVTQLGGESTRAPFHRGCWNVNIRGLRPLMRKYGLNVKSQRKRLPADWYGLSEKQATLWLKSFLACDGHFTYKQMECTLSSEKLLRDIQHLLLILGITSSVNYKKATIGLKVYDAWRLHVSGESYQQLLDALGTVPGKQKQIAKARLAFSKTARNPNRDITPVGRDDLSWIAAEHGLTVTTLRDFCGGRSGANYSRTKLRSIIERFNLRDPYLQSLVDNDITWSKVVSVEPQGFFKVYDLSVDDPEHNFVANNIVIHNTHTLCKRVISSALENAPCMIALVSPTLRIAKRTTVRTMLELLEGRRKIYGASFWYRHNKTTNEILIKFRGRSATILILSAENPEHLKGPNLAAAYMDEPFIMHEDVFTQLVARVRHPDGKLLEIGMAGCVNRNTKVLLRNGMPTIGKLDPGTTSKQLAPLGLDVYGSYRKFHTATKFWNNGREETRKITVQNGYRLESTLKHPILVMGEDGAPVWKKTKELQIGDYVAIGRGMDVWGDCDPIRKFKTASNKRRKYTVDVSGGMTDDLAYFCGLWLAEGSRNGGQLRITCGDKDVLDALVSRGVLGAQPIKKREDQLAFNSISLVELFQHLKMPLVKAPKKWIPDWVVAGKKQWAMQLLSGMYDGDGHVCKTGAGIGYTTASRKLAHDLQLLLLNFGVIASLQKVKNPPTERVKVWSTVYHVLAIGNSAARLADILKLRIARKRKALARYPKTRCSDRLPHQANLMQSCWEQKQHQRWRKKLSRETLEPNQILYSARYSQSGAMTYQSIRDFIDLWHANEETTPPELEQLEANIKDWYYWPKITKLQQSECDTVDFVVPETHSFWSNGFISHNTPEQLGWGYALCKGKKIDGLEGLQDDLTIGVINASTLDNKVLDPKYVKRLMARLSPRAVEAYIQGHFVNLTEGRVYYAFDDTTHVKEITMPDHATLGCGMDFNVDPMAAVVFWEHNNHVHVIEEIELENSDTERMAEELNSRYPKLIDVYPDPAGNQRKTSSPGGKTDFYYLREAGFTIHAPHTHYNMKDTWNIVNGRFRPGTGASPKLTIDPSCKNLIDYLNGYSHKLAPKQEHMKHLLDALRYPISNLFPLPTDRVSTMHVSGV